MNSICIIHFFCELFPLQGVNAPQRIGNRDGDRRAREQGHKNDFPRVAGTDRGQRSGLCRLTPWAPQSHLTNERGDSVLVIRGQWASSLRARRPESPGACGGWEPYFQTQWLPHGQKEIDRVFSLLYVSAPIKNPKLNKEIDTVPNAPCLTAVAFGEKNSPQSKVRFEERLY